MGKMFEKIDEFFDYHTSESIAFLIIIGLIIVWGIILLTKNLSYWFFYEDLVKQTIKEMIKPEYLIQLK